MSLRMLASTALASFLTITSAFGAAADGEKVFQQVCTQCHNAKEHPLDKVRLDREKWKEEVERMEGLGAQIPSGKKLQDLLDYLVETHGPGNSPSGAGSK